jgi:hypothetical protein
MKVKRLEWEIGKLARKPILFIAREDVRTAAKPSGRPLDAVNKSA